MDNMIKVLMPADANITNNNQIYVTSILVGNNMKFFL